MSCENKIKKGPCMDKSAKEEQQHPPVVKLLLILTTTPQVGPARVLLQLADPPGAGTCAPHGLGAQQPVWGLDRPCG